MARTTFGTNDALTVKAWAKKVIYEALKATAIRPLIGSGSSAIIVRMSELKKGAGDQITFPLFSQLSGDGTGETQVLEGNEESLNRFSDALVVNELHHAVKVPANGRNINAQRVKYNLRSIGRELLTDWYAKRMSVSFFNQVCGYTPANVIPKALLYTGNNVVPAASASRIVRAGGQATDEALTSAHRFDLNLLDFAKELAKTADPKILPVMVDGREYYCAYLHPYQVTDLRTNYSTGQWFDYQKYVGPRTSSNPIFTGAIGEYNGIVLREADDVTFGVHSTANTAETDVRRAVLLGRQAAVIATGSANDEAEFDWVEDTKDYQRWLGISVQSVIGMKKTVFDSKDFGTIVIPTYAAAHT